MEMVSVVPGSCCRVGGESWIFSLQMTVAKPVAKPDEALFSKPVRYPMLVFMVW